MKHLIFPKSLTTGADTILYRVQDVLVNIIEECISHRVSSKSMLISALLQCPCYRNIPTAVLQLFWIRFMTVVITIAKFKTSRVDYSFNVFHLGAFLHETECFPDVRFAMRHACPAVWLAILSSLCFQATSLCCGTGNTGPLAWSSSVLRVFMSCTTAKVCLIAGYRPA